MRVDDSVVPIVEKIPGVMSLHMAVHFEETTTALGRELVPLFQVMQGASDGSYGLIAGARVCVCACYACVFAIHTIHHTTHTNSH